LDGVDLLGFFNGKILNMIEDWKEVELGEIVTLASYKVDLKNLPSHTYVSTENMLSERGNGFKIAMKSLRFFRI
jgi:hypothetical protein